MALATAAITTLIDNIISALNTADIDGILGVYFGDQEAYSDYPVICVGAPPLLNENFPVMAGQVNYDEIYNIPILLYVEYADTLVNKKLLYNATEAIKTALRKEYFWDAVLGKNFVYIIEILQTRYVFAQKGDVTLRISETTIQYKKRI